MKSKKFSIFLVVTALIVACNNNSPKVLEKEQILGIWYVDSINPNGDSVNQSLTFNDKELIYNIGPDGDEDWPGIEIVLSYRLENQTLIVSAVSPQHFEYSSNIYIKNTDVLVIDHFSTDGQQFKRLICKKTQ